MVNLSMANLVTVRKSASQQICWQKWGVNLPVDVVSLTNSARQSICWEKEGGKSGSRFSDSCQICKSVNQPDGVSLLAEFSDCQEICQSANLLAEMGG